MNEIQVATFHFFGPITVVYIIAAIALVSIDSVFPLSRNGAEIQNPANPFHEIVIGLLASIAVLLTGNLLRIDKVWSPNIEPWTGLWWILTNVEIYSPIFIVLIIRKQKLDTVYLSSYRLLAKIVFGILGSLICSVLFLILRNELDRFPEVLIGALKWNSIRNFPAVFMEGVAVAFLYVRLKWWLGTFWPLLIPSILFAVSHVPGSLQDGYSLISISSFFVLNTGLCMVLLYSCSKTRDVIFLSLVHFVMDATIKSF